MKVSVVIPAFNAENYLVDCLESICLQTRPFDSILVVNDCSSDDTFLIAIGMPISRIVSNKSNLGIGATRKRGSLEAEGDYVCFLSHDDCYCKNYLKTMLQYADGESILYSDYYQCNERLEVQSTFKAPRWQTQQEFRQLVLKWALESNMFTNFSTIMVPNKVFEKVQFDSDLRLGEDLVFLLESVKAGVPWKHVPHALLYYRIHNESGTQKMWRRSDWQMWWFKVGSVLHDLGVSDSQINTAMCESFKLRFSWKRRMKTHVPSGVRSVYRHVKGLAKV